MTVFYVPNDKMNKIFRIVLVVIGSLLVIDACVMSIILNFNMGTVITFAYGFVILLYGIYLERINRATKAGLFKILKYAGYSVFIFTCILIAFLSIYGVNDNTAFNEDAVLVLGAGIRGETPTLPLAYRLDKAVEYYHRNPKAVIVVSGGQGYQESISEALAMERYLVEKGIPQDRILKEDKSTSTYENFLYSKKVLDDYFLNKPYETVIITNDFHIYRANEIASITGLSSFTHLHAQTEWYTLPINYLRECVAVLKLWVFKN